MQVMNESFLFWKLKKLQFKFVLVKGLYLLQKYIIKGKKIKLIFV